MENSVGSGFRGHLIEIGPHEALLEEVRRTAGKIRYYENMLNFADFEDADLPHYEQEATFHREAFRERQHLVTVCAVAARAGVEERQIKIAETWGAELARVMGSIFDQLDLSPHQLAIAPSIVEAHLLEFELTQ